MEKVSFLMALAWLQSGVITLLLAMTTNQVSHPLWTYLLIVAMGPVGLGFMMLASLFTVWV